MSADADRLRQDIAKLRHAIEAMTVQLHAIESRSSSEQITAEVLRLNDAVRAGVAGHLTPDSQPADFGALLLARCDPFGLEESA